VPGNRTSTFGYNSPGDLVSATDPLGNERRLSTDEIGRTTSVTDALGFTATAQYNGVSAVTMITDPLAQDTHVTYDASGRLASVIDPRNNAVESYQYDSGDRLTARTDALFKSVGYQYDSAGRLTQATDRKGQITTFEYDSANRIARINFPDATQTRTYDSLGRLAEIREAASATAYSYDNLDRTIKEATDGAAGRHEVAYEYDTLDRVVRRTVNGGDPTAYAYDNADRPITITYRNQVTTYAWDNANRLTSKILPDGIMQNFSYDDADRITQIQYLKPDATVVETITYTYDASGRRLSKSLGSGSIQETRFTATYNEANRLMAITFTATGETYTLGYDDNGNLNTKTGPSSVTTYSWDRRNRLVGINGAGLDASFQYDALGRRVAKTVNGQTIGYVYDGAQAIGEITGGAISATLLTTLAIDDVVARYTTLGTRTYLTDALGSVLALAKDDQSIQAFYAYTPYGESQVLGDDEGNPVQYTARENDQTGLYFYRARYYDPVLKRFISEDPIGLRAGTNFYLYVSGNPLSHIDPMGWAATTPSDAWNWILDPKTLPRPDPIDPKPKFPDPGPACRVECSKSYFDGVKTCSNKCPLPGLVATPLCEFAWNTWLYNCRISCDSD
jgi:RHS repeat-associated protein